MSGCEDNPVQVINRCSASIHELSGSSPDQKDPILKNFCASDGSVGKNYRTQACNLVGTPGEWTFKFQGELCSLNRSIPYEVQSKCCGTLFPTVGTGVICERASFQGDPLTCCFNDYAGCGRSTQGNAGSPGSGGVDLCFSGANGAGETCNTKNCTGTCDPCQRDITSNQFSFDGAGNSCNDPDIFNGSFCQDIVMDYCTGKDLPEGDISWIERWMNADGTAKRYGCLNAMVRNIYKNSQPTVSQECGLVEAYFNSIQSTANCVPLTLSGVPRNGIQYASNLIREVFERYRSDGFVVGTLPGFPGYNPFQDFLYSNVCCKFPEVCNQSLDDTCSIYTVDQLSHNPSVANWCGCYLPDEQYAKYVNEYQINKECTPTCNRNTAIPIIQPNGNPVRCTQDICIIDDTTINLAKTNLSGTVNISQMCGSCSGEDGSCQCIMENNNVITLSTEIGNINFVEACTGQTCTITNPDTGNLISVDCDQIGDNFQDIINQIKEQQTQQHLQSLKNRNLPIIIVIGVFILIVILAFVLIRPKGSKVSVTKVSLKNDNENTSKSNNLYGKRSFSVSSPG